MEDLTGTHLGPYQVVAPLGEGGMASVYKAYHPATERHVALKVLPTEIGGTPLVAERFRQEARVLAQLQHPHILPIFDFGEAGGYAYIVMPLITTGTLKDVMQGPPLSYRQIVRIITQIGDALDYAHARGVIHRDVKPSNVLIDERGNCLLTDFGLTKLAERPADLTHTGTIIGTPAYISPEQGMGKRVDGRTDIYALGVILYEMATGRVPFRSDTAMAVVIKHINQPLALPRALNPGLPAAIEQVILKALSKDPEDRYATASEMVQAIEVALKEPSPASANPIWDQTVELRSQEKTEQHPTPVAARPRVALPAWAPMVGGLALIGALAGLFTLYSSRDQATGRAATQTAAADATSVAATLVAAMPATILAPSTPTSAPSIAAPPSATVVPHTPTSAVPPTSTPTPTLGVGSTRVSVTDGMVLAYIPAGEFLMGSSSEDKDANFVEKPQRSVYLDAYWADRSEVTNAMYALCVQAGECRQPGNFASATRDEYFGNPQYADYPVIYISWGDAWRYCQWAGRRLPTEAEWEKAARGADGRIYPWGNIEPSASRANFNKIQEDTTDVGAHPEGVSPYGLFDMAGNVAEWVADWYEGAYYARGPAANPQGPLFGTSRGLRGGAWNSILPIIRSANRSQYEPVARYNFIGFRCVG
jgi:serine/threonine-protein kinase